jgi:hypothetical protein
MEQRNRSTTAAGPTSRRWPGWLLLTVFALDLVAVPLHILLEAHDHFGPAAAAQPIAAPDHADSPAHDHHFIGDHRREFAAERHGAMPAADFALVAQSQFLAPAELRPRFCASPAPLDRPPDGPAAVPRPIRGPPVTPTA